jgi:hypothetical protein
MDTLKSQINRTIDFTANMLKGNNPLKQKETELTDVTKSKDINVINSLKENWLSWVLFLSAIYFISKENPLLGYLTFFVAIYSAYVGHVYLHYEDNIFTALHRYHHKNDNYFSHYSQVVLEINCSSICYIFYKLTGELLGDPWTLFFALFFYSTVHNINYGIFKVNDVHRLHHKDVYSNIGPDIFDVLFNTKHPTETCVENTNHYIPNIIIGAAITLTAKYLYNNNEEVRKWTPTILFIFFTITLTFAGLSSIYVYFFT